MECISLCDITCLCALSASAFIDSSLHQLGFFFRNLFMETLYIALMHVCIHIIHARDQTRSTFVIIPKMQSTMLDFNCPKESKPHQIYMTFSHECYINFFYSTAWVLYTHAFTWFCSIHLLNDCITLHV